MKGGKPKKAPGKGFVPFQKGGGKGKEKTMPYKDGGKAKGK